MRAKMTITKITMNNNDNDNNKIMITMITGIVIREQER